MPPKTRYALASSSWDRAEYAAADAVLRSGQFTMGEYVAGFERLFGRYVGSRHCVMVNSGSSANLLMVAALFFREQNALRPGDEVIVPAVSWGTTYFPLQQYGLRLKFVDVDAHTLNYDLRQLSEAVTDATRAVVAVNLLGNPNDFRRIAEIIGSRDVILLEDNCEALGAAFEGRQTGTFGVMGSFSSFFSHHICTMEGGMVVTEDEELHHILLCLRAHGWTRNLPANNRVSGMKSDDPFRESFKFVLPGYNVRPLELGGAIGTEQLRKLPGILAARRDNALRFLEIMSRYPQFRVQTELGSSSWFGFALIVEPDAPFDRAYVLTRFSAVGIETRPIVAGNFARNPVMKWIDHRIQGALSNADLLDSRGFFIGNHPFGMQSEFAVLEEALDNCCAGT